MQTKILLSIKPEFAELIFAGTKKFEFRRAIFRSSSVKTVVVYASSPIQQVIGEFDIGRVLELGVDELWRKTGKHGGIEKEYFDRYFEQRDTGYAIEVTRPKRYKRPKPINSVAGTTKPPQSFCYIT